MKAFYETRQYDSHIKVWHQKYDDTRFIPHWHPEIELIYISKGIIEVTVGSEFVSAKEGDLIVCDSGEVHYSSLAYNDNALEFLIFDPKIINNVFDGFRLKSCLLTKEFLEDINLHCLLVKLLNYITTEKAKKEKHYDELIATSVKYFCLSLQRKTEHLIDKTKKIENRDRIDEFRNFLDHVEENYDKDITSDTGAEMLNVSKSYFSTLFKEYTGSTFVKYLNSIRIENSIVEIKKKIKTITEIAYSNGFNNIRTFNRVFKEYTGWTPSEFIKFSNNERDNYIYQVRKSAHIEHTQEFHNKTLIKKSN